MRTGLTPAEALTIILDEAPLLGVETTAVVDARDRVLAEAILSNRQIPPADNSAMDGFAVRSEDVASPTKIDGSTIRSVQRRLKTVGALSGAYLHTESLHKH